MPSELFLQLVVFYKRDGRNGWVRNQPRNQCSRIGPILGVFELIGTTVILLLSGWVVYTVKTTQSLHKPHNIYFVANLLVSGMIATLTGCLIASTMMISFQLGVE